jgi:hypothetical protein
LWGAGARGRAAVSRGTSSLSDRQGGRGRRRQSGIKTIDYAAERTRQLAAVILGDTADETQCHRCRRTRRARVGRFRHVAYKPRAPPSAALAPARHVCGWTARRAPARVPAGREIATCIARELRATVPSAMVSGGVPRLRVSHRDVAAAVSRETSPAAKRTRAALSAAESTSEPARAPALTARTASGMAGSIGRIATQPSSTSVPRF